MDLPTLESVESVGSEEARQQLPTLIDRARGGVSTVVTRHGRPCAAIVPVSVLARATAAPPRGPSLASLRASGAGLWGESPGRTIADARDEWGE
jgi:prevent-host-death family protein